MRQFCDETAYETLFKYWAKIDCLLLQRTTHVREQATNHENRCFFQGVIKRRVV